MKAKPQKLVAGTGYIDCSIEAATHVKLNLPGPAGEMFLPVMLKGDRAGTGNWTWNGDTERPTLKPSVLISSGHFAAHHKPEDSCWCKYKKEHPEENVPFNCFRCHSWINDGKIQFLGDSTHEHSGKILDLLDV